MLLGGLQKTTLIDYPGKVACTVFTVGCNFRCPFCHNKDLITLELFGKSGIKPIKEKEFFSFLQKRKKILDGVCITGGEPTIYIDLPVFISKIKKMGFAVKLDTNGSNPKMLANLIKKSLIDYVAMDIKSDFENYLPTIKVKKPEFLKNIKQSLKIILASNLPHEFRTTIVPGLHNKENLVSLAKQLKEIIKQSNYYLQSFRPQNCLDPAFLKIKPFSEKELKEILREVRQILPKTKMRGRE